MGMSSSGSPSLDAQDPSRDRTWSALHAAAVTTLPGALRLLGVAEPDIDDLAQDILLAAYQSLDRFDPLYPSSSPERDAASAGAPACGDGRHERRSAEVRWLLAIAWRQVSHYLDRAYRRREVPRGLLTAPCFQAADLAPTSEQRIAERQRSELTVQLLATIAPERRVLLVLHEAYEVSLVDIATALGLNYNTVCGRLRLAREDYRAAVKRLRPEQRQALRACWLLFPLASELLTDGVLDAAASSPPSRAPLGLRLRLFRLGRALGSTVTGAAGGAALLLALEPPPPSWARRFGATLAELSTTAHAAQPVEANATRQHTPAPQPSAPAAPQALPPCEPSTRQAPVGTGRDAFAEERRLLTAAQEAVTGGDLARALQLLAVHEERFPTGRLRFARERLRKVVESLLAAPAQSAATKEPSR
jgi:DNA-directed RNA polymerase specialized sigma24 family protein